MSYGVALYAHSYGFLAVFAAGLAFRRLEARSNGDSEPQDVQIPSSIEEGDHEDASHPEKAPAYMTAAVLRFNEQIERIGTTIVVASRRCDAVNAVPARRSDLVCSIADAGHQADLGHDCAARQRNASRANAV